MGIDATMVRACARRTSVVVGQSGKLAVISTSDNCMVDPIFNLNDMFDPIFSSLHGCSYFFKIKSLFDPDFNCQLDLEFFDY